MESERRESRQEDENRSEDSNANNKFWSSCCGPEMADADQMMRSCPCASVFKGSKGSFVIVLATAGLLVSITVTGWVLGVVAFFRTF